MARFLDLLAIGPFDVSGDHTSLSQCWDKWKKGFQLYVTATGVSAPAQKRAMLLHLAGPQVQDIFETLGATGEDSDSETAMNRLSIGYGTMVMSFLVNIYYIVIMAWSFFYLFNSFAPRLPWASCNHTWNTENCMEFVHKEGNWSRAANHTSPEVEFWERRTLGLTDGIDDLGSIQWELALCLLLAWIVCYFCIWKGVKSTGKVVYFTATFPYVMLIILLVRGVTLPGAYEGIMFYLHPDTTRLKDPQVWIDAGTQIFYSYGITMGFTIGIGSYNSYNYNCYRDCIALCLLDSITSFLGGFAIFSVLGFMAKEQGVPISEVAESGPGLAFIVYPKAVTMMPVSQLWSCLFFFMLILLGLDSQFIYVEALCLSIIDMYPTVLRRGYRREILILVISMVCFLFGLLIVTQDLEPAEAGNSLDSIDP